jgi:hypothetical protein
MASIKSDSSLLVSPLFLAFADIIGFDIDAVTYGVIPFLLRNKYFAPIPML